MSKVTSKLQVTIPKAIADRYGIAPGDELDWITGADSARIVPRKAVRNPSSAAARLHLFDAATKRQSARQSRQPRPKASTGRGWTREELYDRGRAR
ncbi:MAG: AbrB/MazE/SpoVT family DNA-binding domain-containing protein [Polyangiaceae bacterium]|nr:AbrB/MazE/SpoVT family DNA-binding domain-containing protein [Polyangiaceae bacterium]